MCRPSVHRSAVGRCVGLSSASDLSACVCRVCARSAESLLPGASDSANYAPKLHGAGAGRLRSTFLRNRRQYFSAAFLGSRRRRFSLHGTAGLALRRTDSGMCHRDRFCLIPVISELLLGHLIRLGAKCHNKDTGCSLLPGLFRATAPWKAGALLSVSCGHSSRVRYSRCQARHSALLCTC